MTDDMHPIVHQMMGLQTKLLESRCKLVESPAFQEYCRIRMELIAIRQFVLRSTHSDSPHVDAAPDPNGYEALHELIFDRMPKPR